MKSVFISYVRDDQEFVDLIAAELRREGLHVWLDRDDIQPGRFWEVELKDAIDNGAYFIACFSKAYNDRESTYMSEELRVACEQSCAGTREIGWLIPVLLSPCDIPPMKVAKDRTLRDIQWIDLSSNWNNGIWKLLQVVRPMSAQSVDIDAWLRRLCQIHIESKIDRDWTAGVFRVQQIQEAWRSLLLPSKWNPVLDIIVALFHKVNSLQRALSERWVEPSNTGIIINITIAPDNNIGGLLDSLSNQGATNGRSYEDFILAERQRLRTFVNWPNRDFAHWIFTKAGDDITVDLLYLINLKLMLKIYGLYVERQKGGHPTGPLQSMYPGSILTVTEFEKLFNAIMTQEIKLLMEE